MSEAGYTLAETLAALAIVSTAIIGLAAGVRVLSHRQAAVGAVVTNTEALRAARVAIGRELADWGPYRAHEPDRLAGDGDGFRFDCGEAAPCAVSLVEDAKGAAVRIDGHGRSRHLPLRTPGPLQFRYDGALGSSPTWPPDRPERQALRGLAVVRQEFAAPSVLKVRVWAEQPVACQYDAILQDCR